MRSVSPLVLILCFFMNINCILIFGFCYFQSTKSDRPEEAGLQRGGELCDLQPEGNRPSQPGYACQGR